MAAAKVQDGALEERLIALTAKLMLVPGLAGHEDRVRRAIAAEIAGLGRTATDRLGNLMLTLEGDTGLPSVMLFAHMDQLGLIVRKIEPSGLLRVERVGGVPERALAAQEVLLQIGEGRDLPAVIANKSHHATSPDEKYRVVPYQELYIDAGFADAGEALAAGVDVGTPIVYAPRAVELAGGRLAGTSVDDRAGCAVVIEAAQALARLKRRPTVHIVFSVQEEFNLRGVVPAVEALKPDIAIQIDLVLATDTPDMAARGDIKLGGGPAMSLYSFHGRGTLNGLIPHPALVRLFSETAKIERMALQRSAHVGALTETSYVQLMHHGIASIDLGFPARYTHSALEVCDAGDLAALTRLLVAAIGRIDSAFTLDRDG
ncbi:MAG: M20/M25/M40 family metallo-hydrolase [Hyphomicrobiaceae bacterium]|jgi:putative aminopeptidase FrvX